MIKTIYKETLREIKDATRHLDTTMSNVLYDIVKLTKIKNKFNIIDYYDMFKPNVKKCYSILNTDSSTDGGGLHRVGCYQKDDMLFIYDSFARKKLMSQFVDKMKHFGFKCVYVNKKSDQQNQQIDCGLRSLLFLLFVEKYGIDKAKLI
jgi:hypothetical protein